MVLYTSSLSSERLCIFSLHGAIYIVSIIRAPLYLQSSCCYIHRNFFGYISFFTFLWAKPGGIDPWPGWHCPSVPWHCGLGYMTRKIVPEMTYNVLSGTLNPIIPYSQWAEPGGIGQHSMTASVTELSCKTKRWRRICDVNNCLCDVRRNTRTMSSSVRNASLESLLSGE